MFHRLGSSSIHVKSPMDRLQRVQECAAPFFSGWKEDPDLKIPERQQWRELGLKSEFPFFQSSSRLF